MDKLVVFTVLFTLTLITIKIQIFFVPIILFLGMKKTTLLQQGSGKN